MGGVDELMYEADEFDWKNGLKNFWSSGNIYICDKCLSGCLKPISASVLEELSHEDVDFIDIYSYYCLDDVECIECRITPRESQIFFLSTIIPFLIKRIDQRFRRSGDISNYGFFTNESDHENGFPMRHGLKLYVREDSALYRYLVENLRGDTWTLRVDDLADWRTI